MKTNEKIKNWRGGNITHIPRGAEVVMFKDLEEFKMRKAIESEQFDRFREHPTLKMLYETKTGDVYSWKIQESGRVKLYKKRQRKQYNKDYINIGFRGKNGENIKIYQLHRLIWEAYNGEIIPEGLQIDHIDGNTQNNNPNNLRIVTHKENHQNTHKRNKPMILADHYTKTITEFKSGKILAEHLGANPAVIFYQANKERQRITYNGGHILLGERYEIFYKNAPNRYIKMPDNFKFIDLTKLKPDKMPINKNENHKKIILIKPETEEVHQFKTYKEAADFLDMHPDTVRYGAINGRLIKNKQWRVTSDAENIEELKKKPAEVDQFLIQLYDKDKAKVYKFKTIKEAAEFLDFRPESLRYYIINGKTFQDKWEITKEIIK